MTKLQHIAEIRSLLASEAKLPAPFLEKVQAALDAYTGAKSGETIEQIVQIEGETYAWCNKHERYEIATNFRTGPKGREYQVLCIAAELELNLISADIKAQNDIIMTTDDMDQMMAARDEKKILDAKRKGTYTYDDRVEVDAEKWPDYDTDADTFDIKMEAL